MKIARLRDLVVWASEAMLALSSAQVEVEMGVVALAVLLLGGGYYFWTNSQGSQASAAAWESVDGTDASAIRAFLLGDPGDYTDEAVVALAELEERSFAAARDEDSIAGSEAFLTDFPESGHALEARGRIAELQQPTRRPRPTTTVDPNATDPDLLPPGTTYAPDERSP